MCCNIVQMKVQLVVYGEERKKKREKERKRGKEVSREMVSHLHRRDIQEGLKHSSQRSKKSKSSSRISNCSPNGSGKLQ